MCRFTQRQQIWLIEQLDRRYSQRWAPGLLKNRTPLQGTKGLWPSVKRTKDNCRLFFEFVIKHPVDDSISRVKPAENPKMRHPRIEPPSPPPPPLPPPHTCPASPLHLLLYPAPPSLPPLASVRPPRPLPPFLPAPPHHHHHHRPRHVRPR